MTSPQFIRFGNIVVNPNAIASVHCGETQVVITLLSTTTEATGNIDDGYEMTTESEVIELAGEQAQAAKSYFLSALVSKKIC